MRVRTTVWSVLALILFGMIGGLPAWTQPLIQLPVAQSYAAGNTYYVSTNGSDARGCGADVGHACASISYTLQNLVSQGDTILIEPGAYTDTVAITTDVTLRRDPGAATRPVTLTATTATSNVVTISANVTALLDGLTITQGSYGVLNNGALTITNSSILTNTRGINSTGALAVVASLIAGNGSVENGGIYASGPVTVTDSTISNNHIGGSSVFCGTYHAYGGGIYAGGAATIINSTVINNSAAGSQFTNPSYCPQGKHVDAFGGGVYAVGPLTVVSSTISNNEAYDSAYGGAIYAVGNLTVFSSTIDNNIAEGNFDTGMQARANGIYAGHALIVNSTINYNVQSTVGSGSGSGIDASSMVLSDSVVTHNGRGISGGVVDVTGSTIANNSSGGVVAGAATINRSTIAGNAYGGAIQGRTVDVANSLILSNTASQDGGGISATGPVTLTNTTLTGNSAGRSGGAISTTAPLTLSNVTLDGNSAVSTGGGIAASSAATVTVKNSIVATNTAPSAADCAATLASAGYNLLGASCTPSGPGDVTVTDPRLGPLADNGGPTLTQALLPDSAAIDLVPLANCTDATGAALTTDQRGFPRPFPTGSNCDAGAYESQLSAATTPTPATSTAPAPTATSTATATTTPSPTSTATSTSAPPTATPTNTTIPTPTNTNTVIPTSTSMAMPTNTTAPTPATTSAPALATDTTVPPAPTSTTVPLLPTSTTVPSVPTSTISTPQSTPTGVARVEPSMTPTPMTTASSDQATVTPSATPPPPPVIKGLPAPGAALHGGGMLVLTITTGPSSNVTITVVLTMQQASYQTVVIYVPAGPRPHALDGAGKPAPHCRRAGHGCAAKQVRRRIVRTVVLYRATVRLRAGRHGRVVARLPLRYNPARATKATLTVTVQTQQGMVTKHTGVTVVPTRHAPAHPNGRKR